MRTALCVLLSVGFFGVSRADLIPPRANPPPGLGAAAAAAAPSGTLELSPALGSGAVGEHLFFDVKLTLAGISPFDGVTLYSVPLSASGSLAISSVTTGAGYSGAFDPGTGEWRFFSASPFGELDGDYTLGTIDVVLTGIGSGSIGALPIGPLDGGFTAFGTPVPFTSATAPVSVVAEPSPLLLCFLFLGGVAFSKRCSRRR